MQSPVATMPLASSCSPYVPTVPSASGGGVAGRVPALTLSFRGGGCPSSSQEGRQPSGPHSHPDSSLCAFQNLVLQKQQPAAAKVPAAQAQTTQHCLWLCPQSTCTSAVTPLRDLVPCAALGLQAATPRAAPQGAATPRAATRVVQTFARYPLPVPTSSGMPHQLEARAPECFVQKGASTIAAPAGVQRFVSAPPTSAPPPTTTTTTASAERRCRAPSTSAESPGVDAPRGEEDGEEQQQQQRHFQELQKQIDLLKEQLQEERQARRNLEMELAARRLSGSAPPPHPAAASSEQSSAAESTAPPASEEASSSDRGFSSASEDRDFSPSRDRRAEDVGEDSPPAAGGEDCELSSPSAADEVVGISSTFCGDELYYTPLTDCSNFERASSMAEATENFELEMDALRNDVRECDASVKEGVEASIEMAQQLLRGIQAKQAAEQLLGASGGCDPLNEDVEHNDGTHSQSLRQRPRDVVMPSRRQNCLEPLHRRSAWGRSTSAP